MLTSSDQYHSLQVYLLVDARDGVKPQQCMKVELLERRKPAMCPTERGHIGAAVRSKKYTSNRTAISTGKL